MTIRYSRRKIKPEINIIPLLDVLLVLTFILIMTTPIITQSINVDLPDSNNSKTIDNNKLPVIIEVYDIGQYNLITNHQRYDQLPSEKIIFEARNRALSNPETVFLIGGSKNIPYNEIVKILNLLHQAGIKSVGLMTFPI